VKVKRPGLVARHREGYVTVSFEERLEESLLSPLAFPKEKGSLPVTLDLGKPTDTDRVMVPMTAEMPLSRLTMLPREDGYIGRVHVYLSIYDADGNNVGYHHLIRDVNVAAADQARIKNGFFRYKMNVALKKGEFTFLVTLRDDVSNEIGTATQNARL